MGVVPVEPAGGDHRGLASQVRGPNGGARPR